MQSAQPLLKTSELSRRLGIPARTLQRWRREGHIRPELVTPGGQSWWVEADVRDQLRELQRQREAEQD